MKTLVTCHANADADAFAAMLAAAKLYENAVLYFPGTQEAALHKLFQSLDKGKFGFVSAQEINWDEIEKLAVVDTRQKSRLEHVARLLTNPEVKIECWDHHPPSSDDLENCDLKTASAGAVTSLLCKELRKRSIRLEPEEATLLGLGIYGDTGSFAYSSTTVDDFAAAAWLLEQGMDVTRISEMANNELTSLHVQALNSLLESAQTYMINENPVTLAETSLEHYLGDFAYLAHKLMEMEKFSTLFIIGLMDDRIQVVARSRNEAIDVGAICRALGGGGHVYAASASIRSKMITEVREKILRGLYSQVGPEKLAKDYMSSPAIGLESQATIRDADDLMLHFGLKAIPVFHPGSRAIAGLLDAQTAARAAAHGLGDQPVAEYMQRRVSTLPPDASIRELTEIIVGGRQRLTPIVQNDQVVGVVTRTDLINVFANESLGLKLEESRNGKQRDVRNLLKDRLSPETNRILKMAGDIGRRMGIKIYAVGGFARDLLLDYPNQDIDLVAEGDGLDFAQALSKELGGRVRQHQKFLTSVIVYHDASGVERHIDVATARLEYYEYPAALPTVELSSIKMDLFRRDFSINALAIRLDCEPWGQLVDFFGGRRDIKDRLIRALHTLSFVEDPTRCIRAARFEQRYGFKIGAGTEKLIRNILPMRLLEKLSPHRLFNEIRHICEESHSDACFARLGELGILSALCPNLDLNPQRKELLTRTKNMLAWYRMLFFDEPAEAWICYFLTLAHNQNYAGASDIYKGLGLPESSKQKIMRAREYMRSIRGKLTEWQKKHDKGSGRISALCDLLRPASLESLLYFLAVTDNAGLEKNISRYITQWSREKTQINGNDLRKLGLPPGPEYGRLLKLALDAKLDGKAPSAKSQLALVMEDIKKEAARKESEKAPK